jgi:hypothetical protein
VKTDSGRLNQRGEVRLTLAWAALKDVTHAAPAISQQLPTERAARMERSRRDGSEQGAIDVWF